jgi:hypothetical protein
VQGFLLARPLSAADLEARFFVRATEASQDENARAATTSPFR